MKIVTIEDATEVMARYESDALETLGLSEKLAKGVSSLRGKQMMDADTHLSVVLHILVAFASGEREDAEALAWFLCLHMAALKMEQERIAKAEEKSPGWFSAPPSVN